MRQGHLCSWNLPRALDVFLRKQMREARGNDLPKPYVIFTRNDGAGRIEFELPLDASGLRSIPGQGLLPRMPRRVNGLTR